MLHNKGPWLSVYLCNRSIRSISLMISPLLRWPLGVRRGIQGQSKWQQLTAKVKGLAPTPVVTTTSSQPPPPPTTHSHTYTSSVTCPPGGAPTQSNGHLSLHSVTPDRHSTSSSPDLIISELLEDTSGEGSSYFRPLGLDLPTNPPFYNGVVGGYVWPVHADIRVQLI